MIHRFLATYDFNLPLNDAATDPGLPAIRRRLARLGASEGLDDGVHAAQEMADVFLHAAREHNAGIHRDDSRARVRMRDLLTRRVDYQRELFDELYMLPLSDAAAHLCWLAELMKQRADMYAPVRAARARSRVR